MNDGKSNPSDEPISTTMGNKNRCKTCHHKLNGSVTADNCQRRECPQKEDKSFQILTFKDWKDSEFKVIEQLECKVEDYEWPTSTTGYGWYLDPVTKEWKEKDYSNEYYGC